jgi:CheY-like chemotaxis protein
LSNPLPVRVSALELRDILTVNQTVSGSSPEGRAKASSPKAEQLSRFIFQALLAQSNRAKYNGWEALYPCQSNWTGFWMSNYMSNTTSNSNPIILIDDDVEDIEFFKQGFKELGIPNVILVFNDGDKFYDYISTTDNNSFFIFCDINMHRIGGFQLKQKIFDNEELRLKCIPFLMMSTTGAPDSILEAYSLNVQGYFIKPNTIAGIREMFNIVVKYWSISQRPVSQQ